MTIDELLVSLEAMASEYAGECRRSLPCTACDNAGRLRDAASRLKRYRAENAKLKARVRLLERNLGCVGCGQEAK